MKITAIGKTDTGLWRSNNEDAFVILPQHRCSAVADGMGGAAAGEIASRIFIAAVQAVFDGSSPTCDEEIAAVLQRVFQRGNEMMMRWTEENPEHRGMGSTAELIAFTEDRYGVGHVGDSRTYLFRAGKLRQLTKDHSLVQHQVDQGLITAQQARRHPMKNVILRALGTDASLSLDIVRGRLLPRDTFLLCSDGLSDMVNDEEITAILASRASLSEKVDMLIGSAINAGGKDNVTVVLCEAGALV